MASASGTAREVFAREHGTPELRRYLATVGGRPAVGSESSANLERHGFEITHLRSLQ